MRITQFSLQQSAKFFATGLMTLAAIAVNSAVISPNAQAQLPNGRYQIQSSGQIFFFPADGSNPVVVYNAGGRAVAIIQYNGAVYTAFERGFIYRSPDG